MSGRHRPDPFGASGAPLEEEGVELAGGPAGRPLRVVAVRDGSTRPARRGSADAGADRGRQGGPRTPGARVDRGAGRELGAPVGPIIDNAAPFCFSADQLAWLWQLGGERGSDWLAWLDRGVGTPARVDGGPGGVDG